MIGIHFFTSFPGTRARAFTGLAAAALIVALVSIVPCHGMGTAEKAKTADTTSTPLDKGWPRLYTIDGNEITLHQPQIDEWRDYTTLLARLAVTVKPKGAKEPTLGVVELKAKTVTDHEKRLVTMYKPEITDVRFQDVDPEQAAALEKTVRSVPPARDYTEIALDRVVAYVEQGQAKDEGVEVNLDPPPIFYGDGEAILVAFLGAPRFSPIEGTGLEFGLNTNWDVIRDKATGQNYLLYRDGWLMTADLLKGTWEQVKKLPDDMKKLPKDEAWERVSKSVPGKKLSSIPRVFVSETPGEVIITEGRPKFRTISGTKLSAVSNSENSLFYHSGDSNFYFMAAGRWFSAKDLAGPWTAATKSLPADFAAIPKDDPSADILASVPGTDEARDVVLLASIPKIGVVNRSEAKAVVTYDGEPDFQPIENTSVKYAVNTANDVFLVGSSYYVCYEGVWFTGKSPTGPWVVADAIPKEIYSIPTTSPKHHVTYVYAYDSTPTTVTCGYTSGYYGEVVCSGVVMYGTGTTIVVVAAPSPYYYYGYYPPYYWGYGPRPMPYYGHAHYYASPYGYGYSAHGPYGGAGYGASYNPATGVYKRGGYAYGPYGGQGYRTAYNPNTGAWAGQRGGYNAYGDSWKQSAVVKGDDWARGGSVSNSQGTTGGFQTSGGAAGVGYKGDQGSGYVVKDGEGNVYAGKDGNAYKRDENGDWTSAGGGGTATPKTGEASAGTRDAASTGTKPATGATAKPATGATAKPATGATTKPATGATAKPATGATTKPATGATTKPATGTPSSVSSPNVQNQLNRDYQARQTGNQRATQSSTRRAPSGGRRGR